MQQVVIHFEFPDCTQEQYNAVWDGLRASGNANPKGLVFHVGAKSKDGGLFVTDVWESEEDFREFGKILMPLIQQQGMPMGEPSILPVYYVYEGRHEMA